MMTYILCVVYKLRLIIISSLIANLACCVWQVLKHGQASTWSLSTSWTSEIVVFPSLSRLMIAIFCIHSLSHTAGRNEAVWRKCVRSPGYVITMIKEDIKQRSQALNITVHVWNSCDFVVFCISEFVYSYYLFVLFFYSYTHISTSFTIMHII